MKEMHPRNIYNKRIDFKSLANMYPDFKKHVNLNVKGKVNLNFNDPEALRALAKALLKNDFNVDIEIPINSLVPTIPLRLNYILFIEDLLAYAKITENIIGVDIGTGGSCIYPLLAVSKNKWKMVATDCNGVNLRYANTNVAKNNLEEYIKVIGVSGDTTLKELLDKDDVQYTFSMCNPPFFSGTHELSSQINSRKDHRKKPNNAFCASTHEVVTEGGEVEFVTKMVIESHDYKNRIKIFTSMLGIKRSLKPIVDMVRYSTDIKSFTQTEFFQGHVTRWGIAWTFQDNIDLKGISDHKALKCLKPKKPFSYSQEYTGAFKDIKVEFEGIFKKLQIQYKVLQQQKSSILYNIVAYFDTWTHSRHKRREAERLAKIMEGVIPSTAPSNTTYDTKIEDIDAAMDTSTNDTRNVKPESSKRKLSESDEDLEAEEASDNKKLHVQNSGETNLTKLVEGSVLVLIKNDTLNIEMDTLSHNGNRSSLYQILQYIKNHLEKI